MITVEGKGNVRATIIADSINAYGNRITTYELEHHRWILAELNTHRILSKNGASSRAIPLKTQIANVERWGVEPLYWGQNQAGMVAKGVEIADIDRAREVWNEARAAAIRAATALEELGLHKQWGGRLLEPYAIQKTVLTGTEHDNLFYLRRHKDAQPEFQELANCMWDARQQSIPKILKPGDWHVPYYQDGVWIRDIAKMDFIVDKYGVTLSDAKAISTSCCAQVSYRKLDDSIDKALDIYKKLIESKPAHSSPTEHQATPMENVYGEVFTKNGTQSQLGVTHNDTKGDAWSGNFKGWIQHRQLILDNACWDYNP